ncbi:MAG: bifunctional (p)ppGpp synthetase/guanosine-3',5'-bis(diphosphate) 3'-pyrophosphohydrolase [Candidatus Diapherotrites archaeon]|uniref:Bifunctional (P)ppGpp synthetase/guanosine-3',5'-bis(Diphosphate) 3'-pyrophosphohydrolase n=1 Tax=Candidatus Iainarchaeum sp. TaxID=3101447 RepID=A0A8T4L5I4_9ARCH|nr:bifunctional (p)ppGpp synthetase/guanosine-3',5'-bis(diphosphate) 3'-pyrophosphohydrolase [Candidatus Diapherotrites archaeon]
MVTGLSSNAMIQSVYLAMEAAGTKSNKPLLKKAFDFSMFAHAGQKRLSGEPYWIHPANVALILAKIGADSDTVAASLLHDTLEDTRVTKKQIRKEFGKTVLRLVDGVTKLDRVAELGKKHNTALNVQRVMLAGSKDWRVLIIKLADRLHNLDTLQYLPVSDQRRIATESLAVHAPIAHKLGLQELMDEIEESAFKRLQPDVYESTQKKILREAKTREKTLQKMTSALKKTLPKKTRFSLFSKSTYKMYVKHVTTRKDIGSFSDVVVLCIQPNSIGECYEVLGKIHQLYPPVPKKIKDFIAIPQPNLYSGIHTTVIGPDGRPVKIYIGTQKIFDLNNRGVLALDDEAYKLFPLIRNRVEHLNKLFTLPKHFSEATEFMNAMSRDFAPKTIIVFTTKGETVELPLGSTPIDFIFYLRPEDGRRLWKAKVNGSFVPLDYPLEAGDIIEILLSKHKQFSKKWLSMANTQMAKTRINSISKKPGADRNIDITVWADDMIGLLSLLTNAFSKAGINVLATTSLTTNKKNVTHFNLGDVPDKKLSIALQELQKIPSVKKIKIINLNEVTG